MDILKLNELRSKAGNSIILKSGYLLHFRKEDKSRIFNAQKNTNKTLLKSTVWLLYRHISNTCTNIRL